MEDLAASRRPPSRLPGLGSYRGRYLYLAIVVILGFSCAGVVGYLHVSDVSEQNLRNIRQRAQATASLHDTLALLQQIQNQVGRFLINPPQESAKDILITQQRLQGAMRQLQSAAWIRNSGEMALLADTADASLEQLAVLVDKLIQLRAERSLWLPATQTIETGILPATLTAQVILSELIGELDLAPINRTNIVQRGIINAMQLRWMQAIAEVRLLITNRFGVFTSDSESGMATRAGNIQIYLEQFRADLARLKQLDAEGQLGFIASARLNNLQAASDDWETAVQQALSQLTGANWRPDMNLVGDGIEPLIDTLQQRLSSLRLELDIESARNITELTEVSRELTQFAALLIGAGALFAAIAYLMFDRTLLRPIQQTTLALKQEASGKHAIHPPTSTAQEIHDLVAAFDEMRKQVRQRQEHLDHLAHHDALTDLPNRLLFRDRLEHALAFARRDGLMNAILFLDLDGFKKINDTLGHAAGDQLLRTASDRLRMAVRSSDTIARLGGDEFAILIERLEHRNDVTRLGEKILAALEQPFEVEGRQLHISTSIGIAISPLDGEDTDSLTRAADTAMYAAKQAGKGCFRYFTADMSRQANEYMELETALRDAIHDQAFRLHFQPIIDARTGKLHGCEALLRWQHPDSGPMSPAVFVPVLEDMGKVGVVSQWIIGQLGELQRRFGDGEHRLTLSVNLTARLLYDEGFSRFLLEQLRQDSDAARHLIIEITEDSLSEDLDGAARVLRQLKILGVRIALDDFGTGQSSLNHLRHFPFDLVKIDREFVRDMPHDPNDVSLVQAVIELSHAFDMKVVAEGVETEDQDGMLKELGCDYLQGYRISRPMTAEALEDFLAEYTQGSEQPKQLA